jgi:hypothetical protein
VPSAGQLIVVNHVVTCNGRGFVAGPNQGRACRCRDIDRLAHVLPDGEAGDLEDRSGGRYVEHRASAPRQCSACDGPIHQGEPYFALVSTFSWVQCCRCTIAY